MEGGKGNCDRSRTSDYGKSRACTELLLLLRGKGGIRFGIRGLTVAGLLTVLQDKLKVTWGSPACLRWTPAESLECGQS